MLEKIIEIISKYQSLPEDKILLDSHLIKDLGLSSLDVVGLVGQFEEAFDMEIPDRKIMEFKTVRNIFDYIQANNSDDSQ